MCISFQPNESQSAEKSSVSDIRQLKAQLARAKKAEENLKETRMELDEMTEKNDSLERELSERENEVKLLQRELKTEVRLREETAQENTQLQLEVERLKHKERKKGVK